jgi:hypothetical protein
LSDPDNKASNNEVNKEEGTDSTKTHSKGDKDEHQRDERNVIKVYEDSSMRK